jgi:hypothetical protein
LESLLSTLTAKLLSGFLSSKTIHAVSNSSVCADTTNHSNHLRLLGLPSCPLVVFHYLILLLHSSNFIQTGKRLLFYLLACTNNSV